MCDPVSMTVAAIAGSTALQVHQGEQARKATNTARDQAAVAADQAYNKANGKKPNAAAMMAGNVAAAQGGASGTMLTSPTGVDSSTLTLGRSTLLGG